MKCSQWESIYLWPDGNIHPSLSDFSHLKHHGGKAERDWSPFKLSYPPLAFLVHFEEDNCLAYFLVNHSIQVLQWPFPPPCSKKILLEMTVCFIFSNVLIVNLKLIDPFSMQWQIVTYFSITFSNI